MINEKNLLIANKYAESLIDLCKDGKISYERMSQDLESVIEILKHSPDLFSALINPLVSLESKLEIVDVVFLEEIDSLVKNFLNILIEKNRFNVISDIIEVYFVQTDKLNNIAKIEIVSAIELSDEEKSRIQDKVSQKLNKTVKTTWTVNDLIIAGIVVKVADDVIDMSLNNKIENLKKNITK